MFSTEFEQHVTGDDLTNNQLTDDETAMTEISFLPDGRICLFGASREIIELLWTLNLGDRALLARHLSIQAAATQSVAIQSAAIQSAATRVDAMEQNAMEQNAMEQNESQVPT